MADEHPRVFHSVGQGGKSAQWGAGYDSKENVLESSG